MIVPTFSSFAPVLDAQPATVWSAVAALASVATAIVAAITLFAIRDDSRDRTRPMMTAELVPTVLSQTLEVLITNRGQSVARDVKVTFVPPLPALTGKDAEGLVVPFLQRRYVSPISTVTPGMTMRNIYQSGSSDREPVPDDFQVNFDYRDDRGRRYRDSYDLSVTLFKHETMAGPSGTTEKQIVRRVTKALEAIARGVGRA